MNVKEHYFSQLNMLPYIQLTIADNELSGQKKAHKSVCVLRGGYARHMAGLQFTSLVQLYIIGMEAGQGSSPASHQQTPSPVAA